MKRWKNRHGLSMHSIRQPLASERSNIGELPIFACLTWETARCVILAVTEARVHLLLRDTLFQRFKGWSRYEFGLFLVR